MRMQHRDALRAPVIGPISFSVVDVAAIFLVLFWMRWKEKRHRRTDVDKVRTICVGCCCLFLFSILVRMECVDCGVFIQWLHRCESNNLVYFWTILFPFIARKRRTRERKNSFRTKEMLQSECVLIRVATNTATGLCGSYRANAARVLVDYTAKRSKRCSMFGFHPIPDACVFKS